MHPKRRDDGRPGGVQHVRRGRAVSCAWSREPTFPELHLRLSQKPSLGFLGHPDSDGFHGGHAVDVC